MPRFILRFLLFLASYYLLLTTGSHIAFAQQEFTAGYDTSYTIDTNGSGEVLHNITLTNNFSTIYATSYSLFLEGKVPEEIQATEGERALVVQTTQEGDKVRITVTFQDAVVGKNKPRLFTIKYKIPRLAVQNGQVWDLTIPKLASPEAINDYRLTLRVPESFGNPAYISPEPKERVVQENQEFIFQKDDLVKAGVVAAFGQSQVFSFSLAYHLQNPHIGPGETEIALVPDTAFQRVYYESLDPKPLKVRIDADGNWLATYRLNARENLDVFLKGHVQIFAQPQEFYPRINPNETLHYLTESEFWQISDPQIKTIARSLKTPRAIYDFVTGNLSYDYSRVREGVERLGARGALQDPESAICMEFTDLFIALSRAAGIPAREINGYAHTENPEIQPLSLVADVLHAWPEYWDEKTGVWKPVDPTWGNTTGGVDFFDKFDLAHITFAIHGTDPKYPVPAGSYKLASNPQKDVEVNFSSLPKARTSHPKIEADFSGSLLPFRPGTLSIKISNPGPTASYKKAVNIKGKDVSISEEEHYIDFLAPFEEEIITIPVKASLFPKSDQGTVLISMADTNFAYTIPLEKVRLAWASIVFAGLLLLASILLVILKPKPVSGLIQKIWKLRFLNRQTNYP